MLKYHINYREQQGSTHDCRVVQVSRGLHFVTSNPGPGENGFGHDRSADQTGKGQTQNRDNRDQGIAQRVNQDNGSFPQAFSPRRTNKIRR